MRNRVLVRFAKIIQVLLSAVAAVAAVAAAAVNDVVAVVNDGEVVEAAASVVIAVRVNFVVMF